MRYDYFKDISLLPTCLLKIVVKIISSHYFIRKILRVKYHQEWKCFNDSLFVIFSHFVILWGLMVLIFIILIRQSPFPYANCKAVILSSQKRNWHLSGYLMGMLFRNLEGEKYKCAMYMKGDTWQNGLKKEEKITLHTICAQPQNISTCDSSVLNNSTFKPLPPLYLIGCNLCIRPHSF